MMTGMLGSEKIFDSYLSGKPGKTTFKQDIWNYVLPKSGNVVPAQDGDDVKLTIDKNIQIFVEDSLDMMVKRYNPKDIFAVVMDAKTGEILGSSQRPTFNPQTREGFGENGPTICIRIRMSQVLLLRLTVLQQQLKKISMTRKRSTNQVNEK